MSNSHLPDRSTNRILLHGHPLTDSNTHSIHTSGGHLVNNQQSVSETGPGPAFSLTSAPLDLGTRNGNAFSAAEKSKLLPGQILSTAQLQATVTEPSSVHVTNTNINQNTVTSDVMANLTTIQSSVNSCIPSSATNMSMQQQHQQQIIEFHPQDGLNTSSVGGATSHIYSPSINSNLQVIADSSLGHGQIVTSMPQHSQPLTYVSNGGMQSAIMVPSSTINLRDAQARQSGTVIAVSSSQGSALNMVPNVANQGKLVSSKDGDSQIIHQQQIVQQQQPSLPSSPYCSGYLANSTFPPSQYTSSHPPNQHVVSANEDGKARQYDGTASQQKSVWMDGQLGEETTFKAVPGNILQSSETSSEVMDGTNRATYVLAATDLHQLQRSGGQLLLQQSIQQPTSVENISMHHENISHDNARGQVNATYININAGMQQKNDDSALTDSSQQQNNYQMSQVSMGSNTTDGQDSLELAALNKSALRPYKCDQCTASFIEPEECEEHKRKHSTDGPFTCEDCHFSFMYKSHFKSHKTRCEKKRASMPQPAAKQVINFPVVKRMFPTHNSPDTTRGISNKKKGARVSVQQNTKVKTEAEPSFFILNEDGYPINGVKSGNGVIVSAASENLSTSPRKTLTLNRGTKRVINPINIKASSANDFNTFNPHKPSFKRLKNQNNELRPFECDECDASFTTNEDLITHKSKHSSDGPFKCDSCQFLYLYRKLYDAHKRKCKKAKTKSDGSVNPPLEVIFSSDPPQYNQQTVVQQHPRSASLQQQQQQQQQAFVTKAQGTSQQPIIYLDAQQQNKQHPQFSNVQQIDLSSLASSGGLIALQPSGAPQTQQQTILAPNSQPFQIVAPGSGIQVLDGSLFEVRGQHLVAVGNRNSSDIKYELVSNVEPQAMSFIRKSNAQ